ncbi:MAG: tetratricopeptide repeat protein, partial [Candidatus Eremiobacteraeota bacterium]|nr:tetratricopeptide repeat protein [Candidatus Eremiobacteraeota bacterium]
REELPEAIALYEKVVAARPQKYDARRLLVDAYLDSGKVPAALQQSEALTEHYLTTKDHQTAIELYKRLVEADSENVELRERLIKFYNMAEDSTNAMEQWLVLAGLHRANERYAQAVDCYRRALELDESRVDLHYELAQIHVDHLDDIESAMRQFRRVYELAPTNLEAMERYIRMLLDAGSAGEAGEVLNKLVESSDSGDQVREALLSELKAKIERDPADMSARFNYGELCFHLGELDLGIEQFQQTRRDPAFELKSYNMLGLCFAEKTGFNMLDLAIKQFRKGLETRGHSDQDYLELKYNLAMLQYRNGRLQESLQELKDCYAVDIAFKDVREWVRRIEAEIAGGPRFPR